MYNIQCDGIEICLLLSWKNPSTYGVLSNFHLFFQWRILSKLKILTKWQSCIYWLRIASINYSSLSGTKLYVFHCLDFRMTSSDAQNLIVRLGDHNLDDRSDAQTTEKKVKLIVKNKLFSMQTLVTASALYFSLSKGNCPCEKCIKLTFPYTWYASSVKWKIWNFSIFPFLDYVNIFIRIRIIGGFWSSFSLGIALVM